MGSWAKKVVVRKQAKGRKWDGGVGRVNDEKDVVDGEESGRERGESENDLDSRRKKGASSETKKWVDIHQIPAG